MCGIAAIFSYQPDAPPVDREELLSIRERMVSRGPDGAGEWFSDNRRVGLAHRRLAIIDLSEAGAQPMVDPETGNVIVFNGEIYNYRELRSRLEGKGYRFRSTSDTEVLLHLYAEIGQELVHDLRGMYAFVIWDERQKGLFIARDPFGIKPLYYADDGRTFRAASQVKALLASGQVDTAPEPAGHVGFFLWGHVPEPYTLYKGICALPAGTSLWVRSGSPHASRLTPHVFCSTPDELKLAEQRAPALDGPARLERLREALLDTVRHHLVADVPVGVFLSSGLDSTTLAALVSEVGAELHTVTLGFAEFRGTPNDEVPLAEEVARRYGAKHQTVWVTRNDFLAERERLLDAMDQPSIDGVNSYFVSLAAKRAGLKVALSGLGGDELFGGYPSFRQIPKCVRTLGWTRNLPWLGETVRRLLTPCASRLTSPKYAGLLEYGGTFGGAYLLRRGMFMPWELSAVLDGDLVREGWQELQPLVRLEETASGLGGDHLRVSALEMSWYMRNQLLRDTDWASMAHSLEVRVPLVDVELLRKTAPLISTFGSSGKQAMACSPQQALPEIILNRPKSGFGVPVAEWLLPQRVNKSTGPREWARAVYGTRPTILQAVN